jgi:hypothetical protein
MNSVFVFMLIAIVFMMVMVMVAKKGKGAPAAAYKRRDLMTANELEFFGRLVTALPDHYIFPQVAMSGLLEASATDKKLAHSDRLRIAQQRVDYVVCNKRCEVVAVVELDDRTHSAGKDRVRDERLAQAGIRTVRFQSRQKPAQDAIRAAILPAPMPATAPAAAPVIAAGLATAPSPG